MTQALLSATAAATATVANAGGTALDGRMDAAPDGGAASSIAAIRAVVRTHSQYDDSELIAEALLQEDLGIDSIMLAAIVVELNRLFAPPRPFSPHEFDTLASLLRAYGALALPAVAAPRAAVPLAQPGAYSDSDSAALADAGHGPRGAMAGAFDGAFKGALDGGPALDRMAPPAATAGAAPPPHHVDGAGHVSDTDDVDDARLTMRDFAGGGRDEADVFGKTRRFARFLRSRSERGLFWYGMASRGACTSRAVIHDEYEGRDREFLLFASNNYLGLANDPRVVEAIARTACTHGATNTGSRLIGGTTELHRELEHLLARLKGREDCIVFPSGYSANVGALSALLGPNDLVLTDVYNHMSIQDGCRMSGAARKLFAHNDMDALEDLLRRNRGRTGGRLIAVDGVFSMHGDIAPLPHMLRLARQYGARVMVDDAHATGVLGATGTGTAEHFGLKGEVDLEVGTMSKALAGQGGFVVGDRDVIDYLRFYANAYVFAATIPAPVVAGLITSVQLLQSEPQRLARLWDNVRHLKGRLDALGFDTGHSQSAIIPVVIGDEMRTMALGRSVRRRGLFCQTVVFPGVAVGDARLRISVMASHTREDLDQAVSILTEAALEHGLLPAA